LDDKIHHKIVGDFSHKMALPERNLHDKIHGFLVATKQQDLIKTIEQLHELPATDVPKESQFLLDCDIEELRGANTPYQEHWIAAMQSVCSAGL
jgi:hypothetical protein